MENEIELLQLQVHLDFMWGSSSRHQYITQQEKADKEFPFSRDRQWAILGQFWRQQTWNLR